MKFPPFLLCALATGLLNASAAVPTEGLVLHYPFPGDPFDSSASANDGRVAGATLGVDRFGRANSAYHFSGQGEYIEARDALPESESVTVSIWFKLDSWTQVNNWTAPQVVFFEGDDSGGHDLALLIGGGLAFVTKSDGLAHMNWLPEIGTWIHVVCIANADAAKMAIWVNGRKLKEGAFSGGANRGFHAPFNLGRRPGGFNDWHFAGAMDDVRVYNRALSDLEIQQLYSAESGTAKTLKIAIETVRLTMGVEPGRRYILQSSPDLASWMDFGAAFTAVAAEQTMSVPVDEQRKFWRVLAAPN